MIGVFVGDENRVEGLWGDARGMEPLEGLPAAQARVNEKTGPLAGDQGAVAGARGRENRDGDDESSPFIYDSREIGVRNGSTKNGKNVLGGWLYKVSSRRFTLRDADRSLLFLSACIGVYLRLVW